MNNLIRQHMVFSGRVQDVGFRYTAGRASNRAGCTGWVRNEKDGTVTMEIQGTKDQIDSVMMAIKSSKFIRISNMDIRELKLKPEEFEFRVVR